MSSLQPNDPLASLTADEPPLAAEFRRQWQSGDADLQTFLAGRPGLSPPELAALVQIDVRERWRRGQRPAAEEYLARFPQLALDAELALDVIFEEFLAREQHGEQPQLAEYQERFPALAEMLSDQIHFHQVVNEFDQEATGNVTQPALDTIVETDSTQPTRAARLPGDYEILKEIGRGGMGVVFQARQIGLNRLVALKMVRAVDRGNGELLARFRAEAEVVASLHHSQIVQIYDYGEHEGLPYLALEWIEGGTLAARLDGKPWQPRRAAQLIMELARAVHFAHERRVIHRDLKPANLLVASDERGLEIKIADFGLAKVFRDAPSLQDTQTGALLGTPSYMAPEQAGGRARDIGPATDVYALGAILYELLTGRPPFRGETPIETLQQVLGGEAVSIQRLVPRVPHDLATICARCLAREPARRYVSAADLADDLARFLADQPIRARRTGRVERGWRWCRRNPMLALALGSVATLLVAVAAVSTWYSGRLSSQLSETEQARFAERAASQQSQLRLWDAYLAEIAARNASRQVGQRFGALATVDKAASLLPQIGSTDQRVLKLRSATLNSLALADIGRVRTVGDCPNVVHQCRLSAAAGLYVASTTAAELVGVRVSDGREAFRIKHRGTLAVPAIAADGRLVSAVGDGGCQVWRVDGEQPALAWQHETARQFAFAPDGKQAAVSDGTGMRLVDAASGATVCALGRGAASSSFSFHAPSRRIAVCTAENLQILSRDNGQVLAEWPLPQMRDIGRVAWHPGGRYLAAWDAEEWDITLWDVAAQKKVMVVRHFGYPSHLQFLGDHLRLLSYTLWDQRLMLWDLGTGQKLLDVRGVANFACDLDRHGEAALVRSNGTALELWELAAGDECLSLAGGLYDASGYCHRASVSPDNRMLAVSRDTGLELWDLVTCQRLATSACEKCMAEFDAAGNLLLACSAGVFRWPRTEGGAPSEAQADAISRTAANTSRVHFGPPQRLHGPVDPTSLSAGRVGSAVAFEDNIGFNVLHLEAQDRDTRLETSDDARRAAVSVDGRYVVVADWEAGGAPVFDASSGGRLAQLPIGRHADVVFSPDNRWLASSADGVRLWSAGDWQLARELHALGTFPTGLGFAFASDSRALAVGQPDGVLRLVDPQTGVDWAQLTHASSSCASRIAFSPDRRLLVALPLEGALPGWFWNLAAMRGELAKRGLDWPAEVLQSEPQPPATEPLEVTIDDGSVLLLMDLLKRQIPNRKAAAKP